LTSEEKETTEKPRSDDVRDRKCAGQRDGLLVNWSGLRSKRKVGKERECFGRDEPHKQKKKVRRKEKGVTGRDLEKKSPEKVVVRSGQERDS